MILVSLLLIPIIGIFLISSTISYESNNIKLGFYKSVAFITSIINLIISLIMYILFDFSTNQFQFVEENYNLSYFDVYLSLDGVSIYFVLLTTIIPIAMFSVILAKMLLPLLYLGRSRGLQFRPISKLFFLVFVANLLMLMVLGGKHVEDTFIGLGQASTVLYFSHFTIIVPVYSRAFNTTSRLNISDSGSESPVPTRESPGSSSGSDNGNPDDRAAREESRANEGNYDFHAQEVANMYKCHPRELRPTVDHLGEKTYYKPGDKYMDPALTTPSQSTPSPGTPSDQSSDAPTYDPNALPALRPDKYLPRNNDESKSPYAEPEPSSKKRPRSEFENEDSNGTTHQLPPLRPNKQSALYYVIEKESIEMPLDSDGGE